MLSYRVVSMQAAGQIPNHEAVDDQAVLVRDAASASRALGVTLAGMRGRSTVESPCAVMGGRTAVAATSARVSSTIAGGTSEIQRNIIAQRGLGMPQSLTSAECGMRPPGS